MKRRDRTLRCRAHRAKTLIANTAYWWRRGYRIRTAWHLAKQTIN